MTPQVHFDAGASPAFWPEGFSAWRDGPSLVLTYGPGEPIYAQGDPVHSLYGVVTGAVRTVRHSSDGRRQVGDFYYAGDLFGLEVGDEHAFSAEAMCPAEIRTCRRSSAAYDAATETAALRELARAHDHLAMLGRSAEEKVARFLLDLAQHGPADLAVLPMSRQDMADYLGLAPETVSRVLGRFQTEGLVAFTSCRDFRIIGRAALRRLAAL